MKKTVITSIIAILIAFGSRADASMVILDYQGNTVVHPSGIERNLLINSNDGGEYNIALRPLDTAVRSTDGKYTIPLENLYINNTREDVYFRYNEYSNLFNRLEMGGISHNMIAKIRDFGMVPAGIYTINFEVQATDADNGRIASMSNFTLQFIVPKIQEISFHGAEAAINVSAKDVFEKNKKITTDGEPMVYINSNCDWELWVNTDKFGEGAGDYYIRTISASPDVIERLQERIQLYPDKEILVARGKAPSNNQYVSFEFAVEGKDGKIMKAGNYQNNLRFILREDRGR